MKIGVTITHLRVFGGVRRYIEMGNILVDRGYDYTIYWGLKGGSPRWLPFKGKTKPLLAARTDHNDVLICGDPGVWKYYDPSPAPMKIWLSQKWEPKMVGKLKKNPDIVLAANSSAQIKRWKELGFECHDLVGGINFDTFYPDYCEKKFTFPTILCYGRLGRDKKGTRLVMKAAEYLSNDWPKLTLTMFDHSDYGGFIHPRHLDIEKLPYRLDFVVNPTQDELRKIYSNANVFVGAETHSGWGNCTVEAMACGTPVVCTESGTGDFAVHGMNALISERGPEEIAYHVDRLLRDLDLRVKFSVGGKEVVKQFTWDRVCDKLERIVHGPLNNNSGKE